MLTVGDPVPAFALPDQYGETVRHTDLEGRWVVVWWYPKAATPG